MNRDELDQFVAEHAKRYPALTRWLAGNDGQLDVWQEMLGGIDYDDAVAASKLLYESDEQPRGYGRHPVAIRRLAYEQAAAREHRDRHVFDGQAAYHCLRCDDTGIVAVLSPRTLRALWSDNREHGLRYCAVACDCPSGDHYAQPGQATRCRALPRWEDGHALVTAAELFGVEDAWQAARDRLLQIDRERSASDDFADYAPQTQRDFL